MIIAQTIAVDIGVKIIGIMYRKIMSQEVVLVEHQTVVI